MKEKEIYCTVYGKTIRSKRTKVSPMSLKAAISAFQERGKRKVTVEALRREVRTLPPSLHFRDIDLLPRVCPGIATQRLRDGSLQRTYNGTVVLDVADIASERDAEEVKERAAAWPTTVAAFTGSSGLTVKVLVRGTFADDSLPTDDAAVRSFHTRLYEEAARVYTSLLQRQLRPRNAAPTDCVRWSYDPAPYFNGAATPVRLNLRDVMSGASRSADAVAEYGPQSNKPSPENGARTRRQFTAAFRQAMLRLGDGEHSGDEELNATAAEMCALGMHVEEAIRAAVASAHWLELGRETIRATIEGIYLERAAQESPRQPHTMQATTSALQDFMTTHYDLRFNELTNGVEWRPNNSASYTFQPLDSRVMNTMIQACHDSGLEVFDRDMKRYLGSTLVRNFNAAQAYLYSVRGKWDGQRDYIGELAGRVPCRNPQWKEWFHTWFLGMVAQWDGWNTVYGNAVVPLLIGAQGCGKSTFGQILLPPELREAGYRELVDFTSKLEAERMLTTSLLINLDEFNQISEKTQQGFLKNLIQKPNVKGRRPYSSTTQMLPRYASFIATTNMSDVLSDPSGSRRFIVADIKDGMTIDTQSRFYYDETYAQALSEIEGGRRTYFTAEEVNEIESYNSTYNNMRPEVTHFLDAFEAATAEGEGVRRMKVSDIARYIKQQQGYVYSETAQRYLGRWLSSEARSRRIGKSRANGTSVYFVRPLTENADA